MDRSGYQIGGIALLLAALSSAIGSAFHGAQPQTLEVFSQLGASWTVSHVAIGVAGSLFVVSAIALVRHFAGAAGEGWSFLGSGTLLLGGVALLGIGAWETSGFSSLLAAQEGGAGVAADHAYLATSAVMSSMATAAGFLFPVAITAYGLGMLKESGWPVWLAWDRRGGRRGVPGSEPVRDLVGSGIDNAPIPGRCLVRRRGDQLHRQGAACLDQDRDLSQALPE